MKLKILLLFVVNMNCDKLTETEKQQMCKSINCFNEIEDHICGLREDRGGFWLRSFKNKCELLSYGCKVGKGKEYGLISKYYCDGLESEIKETKNVYLYKNRTCEEIICSEINNNTNKPVCAVRNERNGYRVKRFIDECNLNKYNCIKNLDFVQIDIECDDIEIERNDKTNKFKYNNIIVVNASMLDFRGNINETIDSFFYSTHLNRLPLKEIPLEAKISNDTRRGRLIRIAGPIKVFEPWTKIPKVKYTNESYEPTLQSCYHRCPEECPETYAPVCGVPGIIAREPSLMFKNHCYMDKAQCKMHHEDLSPTAITSAYIESSFMFCLGNELNALYRFLPAVRTLQKMGRLKARGKFKYKLRNMRFVNMLLKGEPNLMG